MPAVVPPGEYGPSLYKWLEQQWLAIGLENPRQWAAATGADRDTVYAWGKGREPTLSKLRETADASRIPVLDLISATGILTQADVNDVTPVTPQEIAAVRTAIRTIRTGRGGSTEGK